jgi:hypothetical protein
MYGPGKTYAFVPLAVIAGFGVPLPFWLLHRHYPKLRLNLIITPMLCYTLGYEAAGINSGSSFSLLKPSNSRLMITITLHRSLCCLPHRYNLSVLPFVPHPISRFLLSSAKRCVITHRLRFLADPQSESTARLGSESGSHSCCYLFRLHQTFGPFPSNVRIADTFAVLRYNYIMSAALDTGTGRSVLFIALVSDSS